MAIPYRVETALERGIEGRGLAREDALSLMEEGPLEALLATASAVRDRFKGRTQPMAPLETAISKACLEKPGWEFRA
jgi:hypothetical protein